MEFPKDTLLKIKHDCIIHFNLLLFATKILLTFFICGILKGPQFQGFWLWLVWIGLSFITDTALVLKQPTFLTNTSLTEEEQNKYGINSNEFSQYLYFAPRIRLARTLFVTFLVLIFFPITNWEESLPIGLIIGFMLVEPLIKTFFNIKTPKIYPPADPFCSRSIFELHKHNPYFAGSDAWTALHRHREHNNIRKNF